MLERVCALIMMCTILGSRFDVAKKALAVVEGLGIAAIRVAKGFVTAAKYAIRGAKAAIVFAKDALDKVSGSAPVLPR